MTLFIREMISVALLLFPGLGLALLGRKTVEETSLYCVGKFISRH